MTTNSERRRQRSERPIEALSMLLESTVKRFSLKSAFLASEDGLLLVLAGQSDQSDTFAAYAPLLASATDDTLLRETLAQESITDTCYKVHCCKTPNQQLFLVALGDDAGQLDQATIHGGAGTERILAA